MEWPFKCISAKVSLIQLGFRLELGLIIEIIRYISSLKSEYDYGYNDTVEL